MQKRRQLRFEIPSFVMLGLAVDVVNGSVDITYTD